VAKEVPDHTGSRFEVPVSILVDSNETDQRLVALVQLPVLHGDTFALVCQNLLAVLERETESCIDTEVEITRARVKLLNEADQRKILENIEKLPTDQFSMNRDWKKE